MRKIEQAFLQQMEKLGVRKHTPLLLAFSGGSDSMVLFTLLRTHGFTFQAAHVNYGLRGAESDGDEQWVRQVCAQAQVPCHCLKAPDLSQTFPGMSTQEAARKFRYARFKELTASLNLRFMVTAHHANDRIETFLYNLVKHGGWKAWNSMPEKSGILIRPLLSCTKTEILEYAAEIRLEWREDRSNLETDYARNQIRHSLIPEIEKLNPNWEKHLNKQILLSNALYQMNLPRYRSTRKKLWVIQNGYESAAFRPLQTDALSKQVFADRLFETGFSPAQMEQIEAAMISAQPGTRFYSATHGLLRDRDHFLLHPIETTSGGIAWMDAPEGELIFMGYHIHWKVILRENAETIKEPDTLMLDHDRLEWPIQIRSRKEGDYFYPFGMGNKKKKVSRYFKDLKVPDIQKEGIPIWLSGVKICAVGSNRIDERFKIRASTGKILQIRVKPISIPTNG